MENDLGVSRDAFNRNKEEYNKSLIIAGALLLFGIAGVVFGIIKVFSNFTQGLFVIIISLFAFGAARLMYMTMVPKLRAIELFENGLRIVFAGGNKYEHLWSQIEAVQEEGNGDSRRVLIVTRDETGYSISGKHLARFDEFVAMLREIATINDIEYRTV